MLRIEDTDRERSEAGWIDGILSALEWLGITWDEGPYLQSERAELYADVARTLLDTGHAYACDCSRGAVEERTKDNPLPGYDGFCRERGLEPGIGRALRFHVPDEGVTVVHDVIRGAVEFQNATIEDFVIVKSNGDPLFVLAGVADDRDMRITHVIRAEEHLPTTPKAVLIWEALGGPPLPVFAHLPVLVNAQRQKLSKRRDRVAVEDYRAQGYLPEAMRNYLVLLGWGPPDQREILTVEEMIDEFRLEDVNVSPAFFDEKRLDHFNGVYIRALTVDEFIVRVHDYLDSSSVPWPADRFDAAAFRRLAPLIQERVTTLADVVPLVAFLFVDPFGFDEAAFSKAVRADADAALHTRAGARCLRFRGVDSGGIAECDRGDSREIGPQARQGAGTDSVSDHGLECWASAVRIARSARSRTGDFTPRGCACRVDATKQAGIAAVLFGPIRLALRLVTLVVIGLVVYFIVCAVQVLLASRLTTNPSVVRPASAIVVVDNTNQSGAPTGDIRARLKWTGRLYAAGRARKVMLVATRAVKDGPGLNRVVHTLLTEGIPNSALVELRSSTTTRGFSTVATRLGHGVRVIVVTDAIDALWAEGAVSADGLRVEISSPPSSHKIFFAEFSELCEQASGVAVGRAIGFGHASWAAG